MEREMSPRYGLRFCPVDLHVHTPASKCFRGNVTPEEYVQQAISAGMRAIAVTDHNTGDWIDRIKEAAEGTLLTVFPGVEISVQPGVHILAIFPEDRSGRHVNALLIQLELDIDSHGEQNALVTEYGVQRVISMIRKDKALPVLAHIDNHKGVWHELRDSGETLIQLWNAAEYAAVEIIGDALPNEVGKSPFKHIPAHYWASDNPHPEDSSKHSHLGIGTRSSLFKLDEPITWEGLRQCFQDPKVRIRPFHAEHLAGPSHPVIERVQIQGGFLDGLDLTLNPNLNCIIGGRGTGKSTLLEVIRYAFDVDAKTQANARQAEGIIEHAFPAGSEVVIDLCLADGTAYQIRRVADQAPKVSLQGEDKILDITPNDLLPIQAYGQKEIYEISQEPEFQLRLLDNYVADAIGPLQEQENELLQQLESNAAEILRLQEQIARAENRLARLGAVREELRRMSEQDFVARLKTKDLLDQEQHLLQQAESEKNKTLTSLRNVQKRARPDINVLNEDMIKDLPHRRLLERSRQQLAKIDTTIQKTLQNLLERIQALWEELQSEREAWQADYSDQDAAYQELLREFQHEHEELNPDRYVRLQRQLRSLEDLSRTTDDNHNTLDNLWSERHEALVQLRRLRREQYELRCEKAEALTQALNRTVRVTIHPQGNRAVYQNYLEGLMRGNNVRSATIEQLVNKEAASPEREAQRPIQMGTETKHLVPRIPRYLDPIDLAKAIRYESNRDEEEESILEMEWGIATDPMRRNIAKLEANELFQLETFSVPDLPIIELRVGSGELGYRPLSQLSVGQRCTALLGIVLLESPATLLIDQPEDDLDNQFIFDQIVETLRREKERRQFIIATHNANIPVSGDAELIVVVQANESQGWVEENGVGSIDAEPIKSAVELILEGGERAFQIRKEKYGIA